MPKRVFWPLTLVIMGLIFLASNLSLLPAAFWNLWPLILIVVGLGGLLTSDRDDWMMGEKKASARPAAPAKKAAAPKKAAKPAKAKSRKR